LIHNRPQHAHSDESAEWLDQQSMLLHPQRLRALYRSCLLDSSAEPAFDRLTRLASRVINAPVSLVSLVDGDRQFFKSLIGMAEPWATLRQSPLSHSFCQYVVTSGEALIIEDAREHPLVKDNLAIRDMGVVAYAGLPLTTSGGDMLGSFCVIDHHPRSWTDAELDILRDLAAFTMSEIELRSQVLEHQQRQKLMQHLQHELRSSLDQAQQLNELKTRLMYMASHELRTPLSVVRMSSWLLYSLSGQETEPKRLQHYDAVKAAVLKMTELLDSVLDVGKTEAEHANFHPVWLELSALIADVLEILELTHGQAPRIRFTVTGERRSVCVDKGLLESIVQNLVSNALKYSPASSTVEFQLSFEADGVILKVSDKGIGIPASDQHNLFELFHRGGNVGTIQGTGLGLVITKQAVERHGGSIDVWSQSGEGTIITVTLPYESVKHSANP
jgi:signal transduction histidine kinase